MWEWGGRLFQEDRVEGVSGSVYLSDNRTTLIWGGVCSENIVKWDMAETAKGGPFPEMLDGEQALPSDQF